MIILLMSLPVGNDAPLALGDLHLWVFMSFSYLYRNFFVFSLRFFSLLGERSDFVFSATHLLPLAFVADVFPASLATR